MLQAASLDRVSHQSASQIKLPHPVQNRAVSQQGAVRSPARVNASHHPCNAADVIEMSMGQPDLLDNPAMMRLASSTMSSPSQAGSITTAE